VLTTAIADRPDALRACLAVAGDWLAVGLDPRPDRLSAFPWRRRSPPTVDELIGELVGAGVARFVLAHGGTRPDLDRVRSIVRSYDSEVLVAGGVRDLDGLRRVRDTGATGLILGEAVLSGAIDLPAALEAAA
jgi:phosphoribosylformimino-5-aminoimidazole carboxamide ribotide isomerase